MSVSRPARREVFPAAILAVLVCAQFLPFWLRGLSPYWGDMTYIHHPWQALAAQYFQEGRLPLWDPTLYFGMPMAATMQRGVFYPGQIVFYFFGFATAAAVFQSLHYWLAGWLASLWLRTMGLSRGAAWAGGLLFALGGGMMSHLPLLNHLSTLSLVPAILLFFDRPALLGLALACAFLAGYPPFLLGAVVLVWALRLALGGGVSSGLRTWLVGGLWAAGLSACQLLPGLELMGLSRRSGGMDLDEILRYSYAFADLVQWVSPVLVPWTAFKPAAEWWKSSYLGFLGCAVAAVGLTRLPWRRAAGLAVLLTLILIVILGDTTALSRLVWERFTPLHFVRYPGNMGYLALPLLALLAAAGTQSLGPRKALFCAALAAELSVYGFASSPAAPRELFTTAGPLVRWLQGESQGARYLISPLALERHAGADVFDWKTRLYGLTNAPYRLRAAGNFGEPLTLRASYGMMDFLFSQKSAEAAAGVLPWAGVRFLLTPAPLPPSPLWRAEGQRLWQVYRLTAPVSTAYHLSPRDGAALPAGLPTGPLPSAQPLKAAWSREDRFSVAGEGEGWAYIAEPPAPGWKIDLESSDGRRPVKSEPALLAFQKVAVPSGPWKLSFVYDPPSFRLGRLLTVAFLMAYALYCYNHALRSLHDA